MATRDVKRYDTGDHLTGTITGQLELLVGRTTYLNATGLNTGALISGPVSVDGNTGEWDYDPSPGDYDTPDDYKVEIEAVKDDDPDDRITWPNGACPVFHLLDDNANAPVTGSMASPTTTVNQLTEDINGVALGTLRIGTKITAYLGGEPQKYDTADADGNWALDLSNDATYVLKAPQPDDPDWERTVRV